MNDFMARKPDEDENETLTFEDVLNTNPDHSLIYQLKETSTTFENPNKKKEKRFVGPDSVIPLADHILELVEKLGGKFTVKRPRVYRYTKTISRYLQYFIDVNFHGQLFESKEYDLKYVDFQREFTIHEVDEYAWFAKNPDFIIFGDGTAMICAKQEEFQDTSDFNIYIIYDINNEVKGPIQLSKFLSTLEIKVVNEKTEVIEKFHSLNKGFQSKFYF